MKIFKLKYIPILLVAVLLGSCSINEEMAVAENEEAKNTNDFVIDPSMQYIVNGNLTYDKELITKSQNNAWNIHEDYSKNRVVISTTPTEFEKYKNSDLEFKKRFEKNETEESSKNIALSSRLPDGTPDHSEGISFIYERRTGNKFFLMFKLFTSPNFSTPSKGVRHYASSSYPYLNSPFTINGIEMISTISTTGSSNLHVRNHNNSNSKTFTIYSGTNYTGTSKSMTLAKNQDVRIYSVFFRLNTTAVAKSMK